MTYERMNAALPNAVNMKPKFTFTFSATDGNCSWFSRNTSEPARNLPRNNRKSQICISTTSYHVGIQLQTATQPKGKRT